MDDLISRQAAIDALISFFGLSIEEEYGSAIQEVLNGLPSAQPEPLTDTEQRFFLAAMSREEKVCKLFDEAWRESYEKSLVRVCREIERKVKKALWTN